MVARLDQLSRSGARGNFRKAMGRFSMYASINAGEPDPGHSCQRLPEAPDGLITSLVCAAAHATSAREAIGACLDQILAHTGWPLARIVELSSVGSADCVQYEVNAELWRRAPGCVWNG